jgi:hypothetical protein
MDMSLLHYASNIIILHPRICMPAIVPAVDATDHRELALDAGGDGRLARLNDRHGGRLTSNGLFHVRSD